jgi:hypothetical protein
MNISPNSTRAAFPATPAFTSYFTQNARPAASRFAPVRSSVARHSSEMSVMSYRKANARAPYATALYAAAVAALLTACGPSEVASVSKETTIHLSEATSDVQEVVVTAYREQVRT